MEEFEHRLHHDDSIVVFNVSDKLKVIILEKLKKYNDNPPAVDGNTIEELNFVWKILKTTTRPLTSISCARIIVETSDAGFTDSTKLMTAFMAAAAHSACLEGIVTGICDILQKTMKSEHYGIHKHQHPLVALLRSSPERVWPLISSHIQDLLVLDVEVAVKIYKPVFVFVFCDPRVHLHFSPLRSILMHSLLLNVDRNAIEGLFSHIVKWAPLEICSNQGFQELIGLVIIPWLKSYHWAYAKPYLLSLSLQSAKRNLNPNFLFREIQNLDVEREESQNGYDILISWVITSELIDVCDVDHLSDVLKIIKKYPVESRGLGMVLSSLMNLMTQIKCSKSWSHVLDQTNELIELFYKNRHRSSQDVCVEVGGRHSETFNFDYQILKSRRIIQAMTSEMFGFIRSSDQFRIWGSKLLLHDDHETVMKSLDNIKTLVLLDKSLSPRALSLINHKLSKLSHFKHQNVQPLIFSSLLHLLPIMAKDKCCIGSVLSLINLFSSTPTFAALRLGLLYELWKIEPRCYNILEKSLLTDVELPNQKLKSNYFSVQSQLMARICQDHASNYGANFLKQLTDLMNSSQDILLITVNALSGIIALCSEGVIDIITTLKVLAPKFKSEKRLPVAEKFYELVHLAPTFHIESDDFHTFLKWCLTMMWKNVNDCYFPQDVKPSIIRHMKNFPMEHHETCMLPAHCIVVAQEEEPVEDVNLDNYVVPGSCWINLLSHAKKNETAEIFKAYEILITNLAQEELNNLPRGIYHLSQAMKNKGEEHPNYNFLPEKSILKAILNQLLLSFDSTNAKDSNLGSSLLKILSCLESRPLPPFDWRLLKEVYHNEGKFKTILAKQSSHSISARAIIEEKMISQSTKPQEIVLDFMHYFHELVLGVPFNVLKPFVKESILVWLHSASKNKENDHQGLKKLLKSYIKVLQKEDIDEEVKDYLIEAIDQVFNKEIIEIAHNDNAIQDVFIDELMDMPIEILENLADPFHDSDENNGITAEKLILTLKIQQSIMKKFNIPSLRILNVIVDHLAKEELAQFPFETLKNSLVEAFRMAKKDKKTMLMKQWLLEIMGQIQFLLRNDCSIYTFNFMFEIFVLSVSSMSGNDSPNVTLEDLPLALNNFFDVEKDVGPQLSEWLLELTKKDTKLSKRHQHCIQNSCLAVKNCDGYLESSVWGRLTMQQCISNL